MQTNVGKKKLSKEKKSPPLFSSITRNPQWNHLYVCVLPWRVDDQAFFTHYARICILFTRLKLFTFFSAKTRTAMEKIEEERTALN